MSGFMCNQGTAWGVRKAPASAQTSAHCMAASRMQLPPQLLAALNTGTFVQTAPCNSESRPDIMTAGHVGSTLNSCTTWKGTPEGAENQAIVWVTAHELTVSAEARAPGVHVFPLTPADVPLVSDVLRILGASC
eukprot:365569-Chlamydomonas_euryale.AAC.28